MIILPYSSRRQARWANASGQPFAKRWNKLTDFAALPEHKDAGTMAGAQLAGPGGLLSTPGLGTTRTRKGKKWGRRLKDVRQHRFITHDDLQQAYSRRLSELTQAGFDERMAQNIMGAPHQMPIDELSTAYQRLLQGSNTDDANEGLLRMLYALLMTGTVKSACTCGITVKAPTGAPGESLGPGITRIRGNLCNVHGRYGPCDTGAAAKPVKGKKGRAAKPKKPKVIHLTPEQKRAQRDTEHTQNQAKVLSSLGIDAGGQAALEALRNGQQPDPKALERGGFEQAGLVEQAQDGSYRMTASGRAALTAAQSGDAGRAGSIISGARDRTTTRQQRQSASAARQQAAATRRAQIQARRAAAAASKPAKPSGGGKAPSKGTKNPTKAPPAQRATLNPKQTRPHSSVPKGPSLSSPKPKAPAKAATPSIAQPLKDAASAVSTGATVSPAQIQQLVTNGLARLGKDGAPILTAAGLTATKKAASNTPSDFLIVDDPQKPTTWHLQVKRNGTVDHHLMGAAWSALHSGFRGNVYQGPGKTEAIAKLKKLYAAEKMPVPAEKSFIVYKDHDGRDRWIARTTTAYQDRDGEIISEAALDQDSQRMTTRKQFGPLRWWHVGDPDPGASSAPWGPGLDIGDCDYSAVIGRTRVESGTFRDPGIARKVAQAADGLEMSPGFFHPLDQPDVAGVFHTIRTFERSVVPTRYGRASNLFTGFTVKEFRMDIAEMEKRFKAMYTELGLTPEQGAALGDQLVATEKAAAQQGIAYKDAEIEYPDIVVNGVTYKASPPPAMAAPDAEDAAEAPETPGEAPDAEDLAEGPEDTGDYIGDMSVDDFKAMLAELLAPVLKMQDMVKSIGDAHAELKGMYGGVATKDDARAQELIALKAQYADLAAKIATIEGDQPNTILPDEVAAALKSAGPAKPAVPENPAITQALNDPNRPLAWLGMSVMPELYQNGANE